MTWSGASSGEHFLASNPPLGNAMFLVPPAGGIDDTGAVQSVIAAAVGKGAVVFQKSAVPYVCTTLTLPSGTVLLGFGQPQIKLKNNANANLLQFNDVAHTDTQILGLYLDGNGANQTSAASAVIGSAGGIVNLSHNRTLVEGNTIVNAAIHGIFMTEATAGQSNNPKFVRHNVVTGHGLQATGYGIYADYCGNTLIEGNYVTNTGTFDCIELGHAGPGWLASLGSLTCVYNIVKGGQINFPFSDNARIEGNFVLNSKISNDQNTANNVAIVGNTVWAPTTTNQETGIQIAGANGLIEGNYVSVGQHHGIGNASGAMRGCRVVGNQVDSTNAGNDGYGIILGTTADPNCIDNVCIGNKVSGHFVKAIHAGGSNNVVADNRITLIGGTSGIYLPGSTVSGFTSGLNSDFHDNVISGCTNPLDLPIVDTDGVPNGLRISNNTGAVPTTTNSYAYGLASRKTAQTAAVAHVAITSTANDNSTHLYRVSGVVTITTLGSGSINLQVTYTDDSNVARTCTIPLCAEAGTFTIAATTLDSYKGTILISAYPLTNITVLTAGTFTGCTYNVGALIELVS